MQIHLRTTSPWGVLFAALLCQTASATTVVLYDDTAGNLPANQAWLVYADDSLLGGSASQTAEPSGVELTTDEMVRAGYSNHFPTSFLKNVDFPTLDSTTGVSIAFELQLAAETHSSSDRAGFNVIALDHAGNGIELGFWLGEIWAQNDSPLFTHGESVNLNTTATEMSYELVIHNGKYGLMADGTPALKGPLRDYSAHGSPPYTLTNYVFFGDNTTSAGAHVHLGKIQLSTVPEPSSWSLAVVALLVVLVFRRRRALLFR